MARPSSSSLTAALAAVLFRPHGLMVYLRHLTDRQFNEHVMVLVPLETTHPAHWEAVEQIVSDRQKLYRQGGGNSWRE